MEEKHSQSPKNEGKDKRKEGIIINIFKGFNELIKDLEYMVYTMLFIIFFLFLPYFEYFRLSYMDILPINANPLSIFNLLFIFILITLYLTFILASPGILLYLSLYYYNVKMDLNLKEFLKILWFSKELLHENLFSWSLLCLTSLLVAFIIDFSSLRIAILTIPFIRLIVDLIYYYALETYNKLYTKKGRLNTYYNSDIDFFRLGQSYVGFTSFLCISAFALLFFSARDIKSILYFIFSLIVFVLIYYAIFIFLVFIRQNITIKLFLISIIIVIIIVIVGLKLLASLYEKTYIYILLRQYSLFGLASNENIVLIKKDICDNLPLEICEKLKSSGRNENTKNKNYLCSENIKDYICLEDVKIIWNGSDKIYVSVDNDRLIIPIPKDYLLNKDFIRKRDNDKTGNNGINNKTHNSSSNSQARNENGGNP